MLASHWKHYLEDQDKSAREALLAHYVYLVKYAVGRMMIRLPAHVDGDDLIGYGLLGLIQSLDKFDAQRNVKFETFAMTRIRGAILDSLRAQDWMPRSLRQKAKAIEKAMQRIEAEKGRPAEECEIAAHLGISLETLHEQLADTSFLVVSLDYVLRPDQESHREIAGDDSPSSRLEEEAVKQALQQSLGQLPERERKLVSFYYFEGLTMKEIGKILGVSEARVCQLHSQALHRLRSRMNTLLS